MFFISLGRIIKFALQNFWRNFWLSFVTVTIIIFTLLSISSLLFVNVLTNEAIASVKDRVDISVFFKPEVSSAEIALIEKDIQAFPYVKSTSVISREETYKQFIKQHADDAVIQESLQELKENPLGDTIVIKAVTIDDYSQLISDLNTPNFADKIHDKDFATHQEFLQQLQEITAKIKQIGLLISAIFAFISLLIVFNTIRIGIYTHSEEISIMKLVGASNWFVRAPFLVNAILYGLVATTATLLILLPITKFVSPYIATFFEHNFDLATYYIQHILWIGVYELLGIILLTTIASMLAIGKYLKI